MKKKEIIIIIVFSVVGFVGGTLLIKMFKGNSNEDTKPKTEKTKDSSKGNLDTDTADNDTIEVSLGD